MLPSCALACCSAPYRPSLPSPAAADRRRHRAARAGSRHRPRLARDDAYEALRPSRPCARTGDDDGVAARTRHARSRAGRAGRRPPPDPLQLSERHSRHRLPRLGASQGRRRSGSSTCRRSAACAASPGPETQESFVGSDFTYEDIGGREFDEYTYSIVDENASWTPASGGPARPAWRLESRRKDASAEFPRVVSLVLKDSFVVVEAEIYNRRNEKQKTYTVGRLEQVEGIWTAMDAR